MLKVSVFLAMSILTSDLFAGNTGNDLVLEMSFSGAEENGMHIGLSGILTVTIVNNGPSVSENPYVSGGFITSLSGDGASPYFMTIIENLDVSCDYGINFLISPIPDWFYFLHIDFPQIHPYQSQTCQFRYWVLSPNLITTSYSANDVSSLDPVFDNNIVQITLFGFSEPVPVNNILILTLLASLLFFSAIFLKKLNNIKNIFP